MLHVLKNCRSAFAIQPSYYAPGPNSISGDPTHFADATFRPVSGHETEGQILLVALRDFITSFAVAASRNDQWTAQQATETATSDQLHKVTTGHGSSAIDRDDTAVMQLPVFRDSQTPEKARE